MAILPEIPGLEVCIKVEGEVVPDFEKEAENNDNSSVSEHPTGHFYVEANSGAKYRVLLELTPPFFDFIDEYCATATTIRVLLRVDGDLMQRWVYTSLRHGKRSVKHHLQYSQRLSKSEAVRRDLVFGAVSTGCPPSSIESCS